MLFSFSIVPYCFSQVFVGRCEPVPPCLYRLHRRCLHCTSCCSEPGVVLDGLRWWAETRFTSVPRFKVHHFVALAVYFCKAIFTLLQLLYRLDTNLVSATWVEMACLAISKALTPLARSVHAVRIEMTANNVYRQWKMSRSVHGPGHYVCAPAHRDSRMRKP